VAGHGRIFDSSKLIHPDMKFDSNSNPPSLTSEDQVGDLGDIVHHTVYDFSLELLKDDSSVTCEKFCLATSRHKNTVSDVRRTM